jgi:uncharacterized membrane protein
MTVQRDFGISTQRIEALTDGIFAFAMTILVLDFSVALISKEVAHGELLPTLIKLLPHFYGYVLSFFVLGMLWSGHRIEFYSIQRSDGALVLLSTTYLIFITFIPFLTVLIGKFFLAPLPLLLYSINFLLILICRAAIWLYATAGFRLVDRDLDPELIKANWKVQRTAIYLVLLAIFASYFSPLAAYIIYALMFLFYVGTIVAGAFPDLLKSSR